MEPQRDKYGRFVPTGTDGPDVPDFVDVDDLGGSGSAKLTLSNEHSELTHDEILRLMGLSVAEWEIAGVNRRKTFMADGRVSRSLSVRVKRRDTPLASGAIDMDEVRELLDAWVFEPPNPPKRAGQAPAGTFVLAFADWQIGGAVPGTPEVPGRGTKDTVERIKGAIDAAVVRVHELRSLGRNIPFLAIPSLGDLVESCYGFYCVTPEAPVLTRDFKWVPAGALKKGDALWGATEEHVKGRRRRMVDSSVVSAERTVAPLVEVVMENGERVKCTPNHPWLAKPDAPDGQGRLYRWVQAKDLMDGTGWRVHKIFDPWTTDESREAGYLAGHLDGEGHIGRNQNQQNFRVCTSQMPGEVMARVEAGLSERGFTYSTKEHPDSGVTNLRVNGGLAEQFRLLGEIRPGRLIKRTAGLEPQLVAKESPLVVAVNDAGSGEIVQLETSSKTYFAHGYTMHNSSQLFTVDMNDRDQLRTGWALVLYALRKLAPLFERVDIYPVGGNHGENNRVRGRQQTTPDDNRDLLVFDVVDTTVQESHHLSHVTVHMPRNPLYAVHELSGVNLAITHGHLFNGGANAAAKAERWWKNQAFGQNSNLDSANILLSGHYHSFAAATFTEEGRVWLQCPAEDNGSQWFTDMSGLSSPPGMLSFVVGPAYGAMRYGDLQIL